jgi:hypothetical protein
MDDDSFMHIMTDTAHKPVCDKDSY